MTTADQLGARFGHHGAHSRPHQSGVGALRDFGDTRGGRKGEIVLRGVAAELANVVECAAFETKQISTLYQLWVLHIFVHSRDDGLVKTRRHQINHVHGQRELTMLLCCHLAGDKDAKMADALVKAIDDRLPGFDELVLVIVKIEDPVQRLLWRGDVVAP